jgi:outer membrane protein TolC
MSSDVEISPGVCLANGLDTLAFVQGIETMQRKSSWMIGIAALVAAWLLNEHPSTFALPQEPKPLVTVRPGDADRDKILPPVPLTSNLDPNFRPIDLGTALRLAGVQNPEVMLARQRVVESVALRQLAAAQILPTINLGMNYNNHTGVLQQSNGNILSLNKSAVYVGAGANAIGSGTVNIPGLVLSGNIAEGVYTYLVARQVVQEREFATLAIRNQAFLRVTLAYCDLLEAEGRRAVALQVRDEAARVYQLVAAYSKVGRAKQSDADRFATEVTRRQADVQRAEGRIQVASAGLCEVLNVDPSIRLHPTDAWVVPSEIVPPQVPVCELIAIGLLRRPELAERRVVIQEALLSLRGSKVLPFSPTVLVGLSAGGFGGGSNLVSPVFGGFGGRADLDAVAFWSIRNMGVGNVALINLAKARLRTTEFQEIAMLDRVRAEVAEAYAKAHAQFAIIATTEQAVRSATDGFREDLIRAEGAVGLPIEVVDSLRLLAESRYAYLDAIVDYNRAQFELYVAMGQPPADALARPVPTSGVGTATSAASPLSTQPPPTATAGPFVNPAPVRGRN